VHIRNGRSQGEIPLLSQEGEEKKRRGPNVLAGEESPFSLCSKKGCQEKTPEKRKDARLSLLRQEKGEERGKVYFAHELF